MKNLILYLVLITIFVLPNYAEGNLTKKLADEFIKQLVYKPQEFTQYIHPDELKISQRLGISYDGVGNKFLIGQDIDPEIRKGIRVKRLKFEVDVQPLEKNYSQLGFSVKQKEYEKSFYFQGDRWISPAAYFTRNWHKVSTPYFDFHISNPKNFNLYAADLLNIFVEEMMVLLEIDPEAQEKLKQEKIIYILCGDTGEMEKITGVASRETYLLSQDQIVSTFNCHRHEVAHLLINSKLRQLPLYTNPFLQEGFATAVGGRGDKAPDVLLSLGIFLQGSDFMPYTDILTPQAFRENDPSLSYPASGIYNRFLMQQWGLEKYLVFYQKQGSGSPAAAANIINRSELPPSQAFDDFIKNNRKSQKISFARIDPETEPLLQSGWGKIWSDSDDYHFLLRNSIRLLPETPLSEFQSQEYNEMFPKERYRGEKYILEVTDDEVKLFNFYTATLEAFYAKGLSLDVHDIRNAEGFFQFSISKSVFDEDLGTMRIY